MGALRFIFAVLLAASLAMLPVSAAMASHAAKAEMSIGASDKDCACCDAAHKCPADACVVTCHAVSAISAVGPALSQPLPEAFASAALTEWSPFLARPDPPPPRS